MGDRLALSLRKLVGFWLTSANGAFIYPSHLKRPRDRKEMGAAMAPGDICIDIVLSSINPAYPIPDPYSWWRWLKWIEIRKYVLVLSSEKSSSARNFNASGGTRVRKHLPKTLFGEHRVQIEFGFFEPAGFFATGENRAGSVFESSTGEDGVNSPFEALSIASSFSAAARRALSFRLLLIASTPDTASLDEPPAIFLRMQSTWPDLTMFRLRRPARGTHYWLNRHVPRGHDR